MVEGRYMVAPVYGLKILLKNIIIKKITLKILNCSIKKNIIIKKIV